MISKYYSPSFGLFSLVLGLSVIFGSGKCLPDDTVQKLHELGFSVIQYRTGKDGKQTKEGAKTSVYGDFSKLPSTKLLRSLSDVKYFELENVDRSGIEFLATCKSTEGIKLVDPLASDLSALADLDLEKFSVIIENPKLADQRYALGFISKLKDLRHLLISGKANWDIPTKIFRELPRLKSLTLKQSGVTDFSFLHDLSVVDLVIESSAKAPDFSGIGKSSFFTLEIKSRGSTNALPKSCTQLTLDGVRIVNPSKITWPELMVLKLKNTGLMNYSFLRGQTKLTVLEIESSLMDLELADLSDLAWLWKLKVKGDFLISSMSPRVSYLSLDGVELKLKDKESPRPSLNRFELKNSNTKLKKGFFKESHPSKIKLSNVPPQELEVFEGLAVDSLELPVRGLANGEKGFAELWSLVLNSSLTTGIRGFDEVRDLDISGTSITKIENLELPKKLETIVLNKSQEQVFSRAIPENVRIVIKEPQ